MQISNPGILIKLLQPKRVFHLSSFRPIFGFSLDTRTLKEAQAFIALKGKYQDGHNFIEEALRRGSGLIIAQREPLIKNLSVPLFLVEDTLTALVKLTNYVRQEKRIKVLAITGSVGKTTTKEILAFLLSSRYKVLKSQANQNNIFGVSKTIFSLRDEEMLVVELGTNTPGEIRQLTQMVYPDLGIIMWIKPVHLEGLGSLKKILEEKGWILRINPYIQPVLNGDDPYLWNFYKNKKAYWFGLKRRNHLYARLVERREDSSTFLVKDKFLLKLNNPFCGFIYNSLAAILSASLFGLSFDELIQRMQAFRDFPSGRMELKRLKDFLILHDAYNANPYSFKEALGLLREYPQKKIAVIGDMLELGKRSVYYHRWLARYILKASFQYCFTLGNYTPYLVEELKRRGYFRVRHCLSHQEIAKEIFRKAKKGWLIFLKGSRSMELERILMFLS